MASEIRHSTAFVTFVAMCLSLVPLSIELLWIRAFLLAANHAERIELFRSYFPSFLNLKEISILALLFCLVALGTSIRNILLPKIGWKPLNFIVALVSSLLLILILFGLL